MEFSSNTKLDEIIDKNVENDEDDLNFNENENVLNEEYFSLSESEENASQNVNKEDYENDRCDEDDDDDDEITKEKADLKIDEDEEELKLKELSLNDDEVENHRLQTMQLKNEGNIEFKNENYLKAVDLYTEALKVCLYKHTEDRAILYSNRAAAHMKLLKNEQALEDSEKAVELNPSYIKARLRRAELYEKLNKLDEALEDYQKVLEQDPTQQTAKAASLRLPQEITERNEKMKTEMIGKLKELGNMVLKPFGLSTNNFKVQQDPSTGSYSINFQQNPS